MTYRDLPTNPNPYKRIPTGSSSLDDALNGGWLTGFVTLLTSRHHYASIFAWRYAAFLHSQDPTSILCIDVNTRQPSADLDAPYITAESTSVAQRIIERSAWTNPNLRFVLVDQTSAGTVTHIPHSDGLDLIVAAGSSALVILWVAQPPETSGQITFETLPKSHSGFFGATSLVTFASPTAGEATNCESNPPQPFSILPYPYRGSRR